MVCFMVHIHTHFTNGLKPFLLSIVDLTLGNDDCDFEELAALLSSDDDDIDEDELDKLVNLAEEDLNNTTSKTETNVERSLNSKSLKTTGNSPESNDMHKDDSHRSKADVSSVAPYEPLVSTMGTTSLTESENTDSMDIPSDPQSMSLIFPEYKLFCCLLQLVLTCNHIYVLLI